MARRTNPSTRAVLVQALDTAFDKKSWHGPTLLGAIRGVSAMTAAQSVHGRKSVWQQVLHAAYWKHRILTKLAGPSHFPRKATNWPRVTDTSDQAWRADVELIREIQARLRKTVADLPDSKLDTETTWLIQGAAAHDLYHAGQIKLMRRLVGGKSRK